MSNYSVRLNASGDQHNQRAGVKLSADMDDVRLSAHVDGISANGDMPNSAKLGMERVGQFRFEYDTGSQQSNFEFRHRANLMDRNVALKYNAGTNKAHATKLEASVDINKDLGSMHVTHNFDNNTQRVRWNVSRDGTTLEPHYDLGDSSWGVKATRKVDGNPLSLAYHSNKDVKVDYHLNQHNLKVGCHANMDDMSNPRLNLEYTHALDL